MFFLTVDTGTTIFKVVGTTHLVKIANNIAVVDPKWEGFVDKISIGATKPFELPENNWLICKPAMLNDGLREVTNVTTINGNVTSLTLDYIFVANTSSSIILQLHPPHRRLYHHSWVTATHPSRDLQSAGSYEAY